MNPSGLEAWGGICCRANFISSFKIPDYWRKMVFRELLLKGERGGRGGGVRNEGEKCEHVCVRGRLMRMQRVEFSIRQFPPSPSLSYSLLAPARKVSFQRFSFFPGCEFTDG